MKLFKRTVSILIGICVLCSVFIYFFAFREYDSYKLKNSDKQKIVELLQKNDIKISNEAFPDKIKFLPELKLLNMTFDNQSFAKMLLGPDFALASAGKYSAGNTTLVFEGNEFTLTFSKPIQASDSYGKLINHMLSDFGFSETLINVHTENGNAEVFKVFDGVPIFTDSFKVYFNEKGIYKMSGIWFEADEIISYKKQTSLLGVFAKIANDEQLIDATITDITMGYIFDIPEYSVNVANAYPVVRITVDDKATYDYPV